MSFCWFTSSLGYPNFRESNGGGHDHAVKFRRYAEAARSGVSYNEAKQQLGVSTHQAETIKAAFQEFGLLYVPPRSNTIIVSPLGSQIYELCFGRDSDAIDFRVILLALCRGLARYQFSNPLANKPEASSSDVLPYLACYYLIYKLGGVITLSELRGMIFGLQYMADLPVYEQSIRDRRDSQVPFSDIANLPPDPRTSENLKIYFISHLSLDHEIIHDTTANFYGRAEKAYELTQIGTDIICSVLNEAWPEWDSTFLNPPHARAYDTIESYFWDGVGQASPYHTMRSNEHLIQESNSKDLLDTLLSPEDLESMIQLPKPEYEEGRRRLIWHARAERSAALNREAKRLFKLHHNGQLFCEVCKFNFGQIYGERGDGYIEAHHKIPISQLTGPVRNSPDDLAMVCSNCHRMLHRRPWITVEDLTKLLNDLSLG